MQKGLDPLISLGMVVIFALVGIGIVLESTKTVTNTASTTVAVSDAEQALRSLDTTIQQVIREGAGASRVVDVKSPGTITVIPAEGAVQFETMSRADMFDYASRQQDNKMLFVTGNSVSCSETDGNGDGSIDLVMENEFLKAVFKKINQTTPLTAIRTESILLQLVQKTKNIAINLTNSSVVIDDTSSTAVGTGYTEILQKGSTKPVCVVHAAVNGATSFDMYYTLYSGADFLVAEVRNVR
ncbi:MAG: hypothetical protein HY832_02520 [Candidatus Aenigmarchaeota archaeon]|nr:hypothetical protein [Candidatus Aenigmarchaeota archaeon]